MAPEQFGLGHVDWRCDIYAIGCIGYELCTGVPPFAGGRVDLMHAHLTRAPIAPRQRCPEAQIPVALEELLLRCMDKDPARRFGGGELARALLAIG
jgi:serine/threonine protein kinase